MVSKTNKNKYIFRLIVKLSNQYNKRKKKRRFYNLKFDW